MGSTTYDNAVKGPILLFFNLNKYIWRNDCITYKFLFIRFRGNIKRCKKWKVQRKKV